MYIYLKLKLVHTIVCIVYVIFNNFEVSKCINAYMTTNILKDAVTVSGQHAEPLPNTFTIIIADIFHNVIDNSSISKDQ